ncbi:MAG: protein translocase subunit SecF, partial [Paludibacteraceae bacterium]|nr:protein translocase subunit SecF [Paludibacteraceae bacterium]
IVQEDIVGPSLGQEAITNGFISFLVAFCMILIYMVFYYGKTPGLVADTALIANVVLIFGVLASFKAVLTLPGIAGIVLTLGMAVDANVLIYERTREELRSGKEVKTALSDGYSNSYSAIFDSNITSILTGIILFYFGTGPIKGFATTLIIGLLSSLFTALLISRLIFEWLLNSEKYNDLTFTTNITKNWFQNITYDFMKNSKKFLTVSGICLVVSIISLAVNGLKPSIDFTGGRNYIVRFENPVTPEEVSSLLNKQFDGVSVVTIGSSNQVRISTNYRIEDEGNTVDDEIEALLYEGLKSKFDGVSKDQFIHRYVRNNGEVKTAGVDDDSTFGIQSSAKVGATMAHDILEHAAWAVAFALIGIFLYLLLRFRDVAFSVGSIASLVHDTLLIFGVFSLCYKFMPFDMSIDQSFVAAILTVIGYSINDTVVIFDRIREYRKMYPNRNQSEVFNEALGSTLSRTFSTSLSSGIVLVIIFAFGGATIRGFIFAMLLGIIFGTYSSIFIASPIARFILGKKAEKSTKEIALEEKEAEKKNELTNA